MPSQHACLVLDETNSASKLPPTMQDGTDQADRTLLKLMALPEVIGMYSTSDLHAPRELQEGVEISIEITHLDAH
jgi:hypothetical protein